MDFETRINELNNGVKYIISNNPNTQSFTILILVRYGSGFDPITKSGTAHLLEHLVFKGTEKRPLTKDIMIELNSIGSDYNAFTSKSFTGYHVKSAYNYLENCIDILTDIIHKPKFLSMNRSDFEKEFEQEKQIVLQELLSVKDNFSRYTHELLEKNIFVSPLNRNNEDDIVDIKNITLDDVINTYNQYYCGNNITVSIHGNLGTLDKAENLIEKYFNGFKAGSKNSMVFSKSKNINEIKYIDIFKQPNITKCHLSFSYPNRGFENKHDYYSNEILGLTFVDLTSGRLFQNIREEKGLIYSIKSNHYCYDNQGYFSISTNTNQKNLEEVVDTINNELVLLRDKGLTKKEFTIGVNNYLSQILLDSENTKSIAFYNAYELFYNSNNFTSYFKIIDIIKSFTLDSMNSYIKKLLENRPILTVIKSDK